MRREKGLCLAEPLHLPLLPSTMSFWPSRAVPGLVTGLGTSRGHFKIISSFSIIFVFPECCLCSGMPKAKPVTGWGLLCLKHSPDCLLPLAEGLGQGRQGGTGHCWQQQFVPHLSTHPLVKVNFPARGSLSIKQIAPSPTWPGLKEGVTAGWTSDFQPGSSRGALISVEQGAEQTHPLYWPACSHHWFSDSLWGRIYKHSTYFLKNGEIKKTKFKW